MLIRLLSLVVLAACAPKNDPKTNPWDELEPTIRPVLPSPSAGSYARVPGQPKDPFAYYLLEGRNYDESLGGAAAGIALQLAENPGELTRWELREALWIAGYPYSADAARVWTADLKAPPPEDMVAWLRALPVDVDIGLVRARGHENDIWVAVTGHPAIDLGVIPRSVSVGASIPLPQVDEGTWTVSAPDGVKIVGDLSAPGQLVSFPYAGEWLVDLRQGDRPLARFPIYAGSPAPEEPMLPWHAVSSSGASDAKEQLLTLLNMVRVAYDLPQFEPDPLLEEATRRLLADPRDTYLRNLGLSHENGAVWQCVAPRVDDCLDRWVWSADERKQLLDPEFDSIGIGIAVDMNGLRVLAAMAKVVD